MLIPGNKEAYVPGFEGTFQEAVVAAARHAAYWKTVVYVYEADPAYYRQSRGLKQLWTVVRVPEGSPLRLPREEKSHEKIRVEG
jgi:hypothetical protein